MQSGSIEQALTVANAIRAFRRWWWLLVLCTIVAAGGALISTLRTPRYYQAMTTLYVGRVLQQANPDPNSITLLDRLTAVYASLAVREPVLNAAAHSVTPPANAGDIVSRVSVRAVNGSQLIEITYLDKDPRRAAQIVTAIANALIQQGPKPSASQDPQQVQFVQQQLASLQSQISDGQAQVTQLEATISQASSASDIADAQDKEKVLRVQMDTWRTAYASLLTQTQPSETNYLSIVETAAIPTRPVGSSRTITIGLAGVLGFLLAFGVMLLLEAFDDSVREPGVLRTHVGLPTVATLTHTAGDTMPDTESFGAVRNYLLQSRTSEVLRVLVASPAADVGATPTAVGIAEAFARSGRSVILVDANVAAPSIHAHYHMALSPGLADAISTPAAIHYVLQVTSTPNLVLVPAGETMSADTLAGPGISVIFDALLQSAQADVLVVDGGMVKDATSATCILAGKLPYTVLVVNAHTRLRMIRSAAEALTASGTHLLGVVFDHDVPRKRGKTRPEVVDPLKLLPRGSDSSRETSALAPVPMHPLVYTGAAPDASDSSPSRSAL